MVTHRDCECKVFPFEGNDYRAIELALILVRGMCVKHIKA